MPGRQPAVQQLLVEGNSLRSTERITGIDVKLRGEGDLAMPDAMRFSMGVMGQPFEVIQVGGKSYQRSALLGDAYQWYVEDAATKQSSSVAGSRSTMSDFTGRTWRRLRPNSPCSARSTKRAYWI